MRLTRSFEERLELMFRQGRVPGGLYRSLGQEAQSVGAAYALESGDWFAPAIRNLGAMLARGIPLPDLFAQYMGRAAAPGAGRDNTTHFHDRARGFVGPISPLGDTLCVLAGVALGFKLRGEPRVALTFIGDGGTRTGAAHEGINFAAAQHLPLVVLVEHNGWAFATRTEEETALGELVRMAAGYGVPGQRVDGNDVLAVYRATRPAVERARRGEGMSLIEVRTYRMAGHAQHDAQSYVPSDELEAWRARDPIDRYVRYLKEEGLATGEELDEIDRRVEAELDQALEEALSEPLPDPETALTGTFAGSAGRRVWTKELEAGLAMTE